MCLVESQDICLVERQDVRCGESLDNVLLFRANTKVAFLQIKSNYWETFCPRQRRCPGQVISSKNIFREKVLPQAAQLPQTSGLFKKV